MKPSLLFAIAALFGVALVSCGGPEVRTESAQPLDLAKYKTYGWAPAKQLEQPQQFSSRRDDLMDQQIKGDVDQTLKTFGLKEVKQNPDLEVAYSVRVHNQLQLTPGFYPEPYYSYWNWNNPYLDTSRVKQQKTGSVAIDLLDSKTGKLVWRGIAVKDVEDTGPSSKDVQESVAKVLEQLPAQIKTG